MPGFLKPYHAVIRFAVPRVSEPIARWLLALHDDGLFTSGMHTVRDRLAHRRRCSSRSEPLVGIAMDAEALDRLCDRLSRAVPSPAFQAGLVARAGLLGDPDPVNWHPDYRNDVARSALFVVACDDPDPLKALAQKLVTKLQDLGSKPQIQYGFAVSDSNGRPRLEHFGFADGISQPGIRGRYADRPNAFMTRRRLPRDDPDHDLFGWPGQHLVWPGEFVLGHPASSPDPRIPGPVRQVPAWMHNGSFLVYRRLRQDVVGFRHWLAEQAASLKDFPGFSHLNDSDRVAKLAANIVGRWPSGAPLSRSPDSDDTVLGSDRMANNDFRFDDDATKRDDVYGAAKADSLGAICPVSAHIRKVNVRDQASDMGGTSATYTRRILRVGVPYDDSKDGVDDRGLLFMSIQASIEDQFEFLQARWINSASRPRGPGGDDLLVGQSVPPRERSTRLFSPGLDQTATITRPQQFVTMTGGGYFFVPSLSTLRNLLTLGRPTP